MRRVITIALLLVLVGLVVWQGIAGAQKADRSAAGKGSGDVDLSAKRKGSWSMDGAGPAAMTGDYDVVAEDIEQTVRGADGTERKVPITVFRKLGASTGVMSGGYPAGMGTVMSVPADPETQKLLVESQKAQAEEHTLVAQYAAATNDQERTKLKESLAKVLDREFDLQQQLRKRELEPIEARVKRLRELIEKRSQARKTIVEKRLDQVLRDAEGMGWMPPNEAGTPGVAPSGFVPSASSSGGSLRGGSSAGLPLRSGDSTSPVFRTRQSSAAAAYPSSKTALPTDATKETQVKVFNFVNGDASSYAEIVSVLPAVSEKRVQITVDKRTNNLVASGPERDLLVLEALLLRLDTMKAPKAKTEEAKAPRR